MNQSDESGAARRIAEAVHAACLRELLEAYEDAAISGLCGEGALEVAVGRVRNLDLEALLARLD